MFISFHNGSFTSMRPIIIYGVKNIICIGFFFFATKVNIHYLRNYSLYIYLCCLFLLLFVHFLGIIGLGAKRWINLGIFYLQPSEFMKICLPIHLCKYLTQHESLNVRTILTYGLLSTIPIALVIVEPDLGTGVILITISLSLLFVSGIGRKYMVGGCLSLVIMGPIIWHRMYDYQRRRVFTFITGGDISREGYQIRQSRIAIGSGGILGKGYMKGSQFRFRFLPKPETDFIFSCICEEWGLLGGLLVVFLFLYLALMAAHTALWRLNSYEGYLSLCLCTYIFFSFFFNVAMTMSLIPAVGVPLPILSRGGSSALTFLFSMGLLVNIRQSRN